MVCVCVGRGQDVHACVVNSLCPVCFSSNFGYHLSKHHIPKHQHKLAPLLKRPWQTVHSLTYSTDNIDKPQHTKGNVLNRYYKHYIPQKEIMINLIFHNQLDVHTVNNLSNENHISLHIQHRRQCKMQANNS